MEILYIVLGLSFPIFYVWGAITAFQTIFDNKKQSESDESANRMLEYLFKRVEENPELSLQDFLSEVRGAPIVNTVSQEDAVPDTMSSEDEQAQETLEDTLSEWAKEKVAVITNQQDEVPRRLADLVTSPANYKNQPPKAPSFSWREWYADHSIDFILYLGAFMIVAAVTLFVGFQWENFGGITRFAIVVAFTAGWYVAGIAVQRLLSLDGVGIAFLTIGAILTPFCGIAWQEFVVGSMDNVGVTWLITSVVGTIIYMALSLIYQRRHFTYFGNLSILASMLSFVELNNAPQEYFILASNLTGLLLLVGRIAVRRLAPRLDAYLGEDFERSSLAVLAFSLIAGVFLLPTSNIPIASFQVLAVMISTLVYSCLFTWLKTNRYTVVFTQLLAIATIANALITFSVDVQLTLIIVFAVHLALQYAINNWLEEDREEIFFASNSISLILSGFLYLTAIEISRGGFLSIPTGIVLIAHSAFFANRLEKPLVWYLTAILFYPVLAHVLTWLNIPEDLWASTSIVLAAVQMLTMNSSLDLNLTKAFSYTSLLALSIIGFMSLGFLLDGWNIGSTGAILYSVNPFASLALLSVALFMDKARGEKILGAYIPIVLASVSIIYYLASTQLENPLMSIGFALSISVMFWIAVDMTKLDILYFVVFAAPYFALFHALDIFEPAIEIYPIAFSVLSVFMFITKLFSDATEIPRKLMALIALIGISIWMFIAGAGADISLHFSGWVSSYTLLVLLWMSEDVLGKSSRDALLSIAVMLQYFWHIIFLEHYVNATIFNDIQWYSAAIATVLFGASIRYSLQEDADTDNNVFIMQFVASIILILPTLGQIIFESTLLYFGLGVLYSLIIGAIAVTFKQTRIRAMSAISLVLVVLLQSREFLINLPRWVVIGVIGLGLIGAGLYLSIRRRNVKKESERIG